jgi:hypothetical protein
MMEKNAKEMAPAAVRRERSEKRTGRVRVEKPGSGREVEPSASCTMTQADEVGFGLDGLGKSCSFQGSLQGQMKDRGISPPSLPVPIASFNT